MNKTTLSLLLLVGSLSFHAQALVAPVTQITLGQSIVALHGPWKFHIGDDPQWANPDFDDSQWETIDLSASPGSMDPLTGVGGFSPGWTAKGHPGYAGYAWYRIRIQLTGAEGPLALLVPSGVDDVYQLFADGRLIGSLGNFDRPLPAVYNSHPFMLALPGRNGTMVVSLRVYMAPFALLSPQRGGMHTPLLLGLVSAVVPVYRVAWQDIYRSASPSFLATILFLAFAFLVLMLYLFDRAETILFWPLSAGLATAAWYGLVFLGNTTYLVAGPQEGVLSIVLASIFLGLWLMTWWSYCGLREIRWIRNAIAFWLLWVVATEVPFQILLYGGHVPQSLFATRSVDLFLVRWTFVVLLILIVYLGWRRPQRESPALFLAIFFFAFPAWESVLHWLHIPTLWFPFGMVLNLTLAGEFAMMVCFSVVLFRRFRSSQRRQQAMVQDVRQAQEVQQVLIPEQLPHIPGLTIESEYRPARELGGDFFQILAHPHDGSVLIVAGDVTGKGLQAGMLVALIVGAIRTAVGYDPEPLAVLNELNQRLCERGHAHATCLALRIDPEGGGTLANAGHLPPYLNGKELPMEGALPLGMIAGAEFSVMHFQLNPGDTLVLMSDGKAEAQDEHGRLFGFERIQAMLLKPFTAAALATAAQKFGQEDDISVVSITRTANRQVAIA